jgi:hypothetical protein
MFRLLLEKGRIIEVYHKDSGEPEELITDINTVQIAAGEGEELSGGDHEESGELEELMTDINTVQIAAGEGEELQEEIMKILESRRN